MAPRRASSCKRERRRRRRQVRRPGRDWRDGSYGSHRGDGGDRCNGGDGRRGDRRHASAARRVRRRGNELLDRGWLPRALKLLFVVALDALCSHADIFLVRGHNHPVRRRRGNRPPPPQMTGRFPVRTGGARGRGRTDRRTRGSGRGWGDGRSGDRTRVALHGVCGELARHRHSGHRRQRRRIMLVRVLLAPRQRSDRRVLWW